MNGLERLVCLVLGAAIVALGIGLLDAWLLCDGLCM